MPHRKTSKKSGYETLESRLKKIHLTCCRLVLIRQLSPRIVFSFRCLGLNFVLNSKAWAISSVCPTAKTEVVLPYCFQFLREWGFYALAMFYTAMLFGNQASSYVARGTTQTFQTKFEELPCGNAWLLPTHSCDTQTHRWQKSLGLEICSSYQLHKTGEPHDTETHLRKKFILAAADMSVHSHVKHFRILVQTRPACCAGGTADHGLARRNTCLGFGILFHFLHFLYCWWSHNKLGQPRE